ncbi:PPC domain-containing DNA-binding protein [Methanolobus sp.]|uniref:PPC domain-containing DNA-binding protein n=1 Tax=Methanolobus sp. TaxID=1874737 RepID=UPI0025EFF32C|nr:PPC domain-containing DNA-binding protein [Methanolobus sp.]
MEYTKGSIGRVFTVRMDHGDDLLHELEGLARAEGIRSAMFVLLGAVKEASLVVGPKESKVPPDVQWAGFQDVHEVLGIGNIFTEDSQPKIHLHAAAGRGMEPKVGCMRGRSEIFMVAEVFILELTGITAERIFDANRGFAPVRFSK